DRDSLRSGDRHDRPASDGGTGVPGGDMPGQRSDGTALPGPKGQPLGRRRVLLYDPGPERLRHLDLRLRTQKYAWEAGPRLSLISDTTFQKNRTQAPLRGAVGERI